MRSILRLSWLVTACIMGHAGAAAAVDPVVEERQADMKAMAAAAKKLSEFFSGKRPYDATAFRAEAGVIAGMGSDRLIAHFSEVATAEGSEARGEIREDREKFGRLARELAAYAGQVAASAQEGDAMPEDMRMRPGEMTEGGPFARPRKNGADVSGYSSEHAFHMMLQTCTSCHAAFRSRK